MDIRKIGNLQPQGLEKSQSQLGLKDGGTGFKDALQSLQNQATIGQPEAGIQTPATGALKFSNHAVERMQLRGISFTPADMEKLGSAVEKAASKGSQNSLVLLGDNALVVSVKNNTVVTVMDKTSMKENVFTNIDSTVVM